MAQKTLPPVHCAWTVLLAVTCLSLALASPQQTSLQQQQQLQDGPSKRLAQLTDSDQRPKDVAKRSALDDEDLAASVDDSEPDKRYFRSDLGKRADGQQEDDADDDKRGYYTGFMSDLGKRFYRADLGKRAFRFDLGKRDDGSDASALDSLLEEAQKRYYSFRSDMGKRSGEPQDSVSDDEDIEKRYMFRGDLGKRPYYYRGDLGKRPYYKRPSFRGDLGKRAYRADLGKRPSFRGDLGKRAFRMDLGKKASYRYDLGKRPFYRADLGKKASYRYDLGKRAMFRSDLGKRSAESPAEENIAETKP